MSESLKDEGRISRLEGIIEQVEKRLGTIERMGFSLFATLTALLAGVVSIVVKIWALCVMSRKAAGSDQLPLPDSSDRPHRVQIQ